MKHIFTLLTFSFFVFFNSSLEAKSNIRTGSENFQTRTIHFPSVTIPQERTYDMRVHVPGINFGVLPSTYQVNGFNLSGWSIDTREPAVTIDLLMDNPQVNVARTIVRHELKNREVRRKDTTVTVTDTVLHFSSEISLFGRGRVVVQDDFGNVIYQSILPGFNAGVKTPEFNTERELQHFLRRNHDIKVHQMMADFYNQQICEANTILNQAIGIYEYDVTRYLSVIRTKRDPLYTNFNSQVYQVKAILQQYDPTYNGEYIKKQLRPYEEYFMKVLNENKGNSKRAKKIRYLAAYNLTSMNFAIDKFNETTYYANMWLGLDKHKGQANVFIRESYERKTLKNLNQWNF